MTDTWMYVPTAANTFDVTASALRRMCAEGSLEGARRVPGWGWREGRPALTYAAGRRWAIPVASLERHFDRRWMSLLGRVGGVC